MSWNKRHDMLLFHVNKKKLAVSIAICIIAIVGDKNSEGRSNGLVAAICDNTTHGLIGAFTWIGISVARLSHPSIYFFFEVILSGLLSSLMDLDHFVAAKSLHLKDAVNLKGRPPLHCTTLVLFIIVSLAYISCMFKMNGMYKFSWILAAAFLSHHIRDSKRRGLWLWPLGSTPPLPIFLYLTSQMLLPHIFAIIMFKLSPFNNEQSFIMAEEVV